MQKLIPPTIGQEGRRGDPLLWARAFGLAEPARAGPFLPGQLPCGTVGVGRVLGGRAVRTTRARRVVGLVLCVAAWVTAISANGAVSVAAEVSGLTPAAAGDPSTFVSLSPARIVAFELSRIATIFPQHHDIAMDLVVTESGIHLPKV